MVRRKQDNGRKSREGRKKEEAHKNGQRSGERSKMVDREQSDKNTPRAGMTPTVMKNGVGMAESTERP